MCTFQPGNCTCWGSEGVKGKTTRCTEKTLKLIVSNMIAELICFKYDCRTDVFISHFCFANLILFCRSKTCQIQGRSFLKCQRMSGKISTEPLHEDCRGLCSLFTGVSLACMTRKITWGNTRQKKSTH